MKETACCITGHRVLKDEREELEKKLKAALEELVCEGVTRFFVGGARGFDMLAAEAVLCVKKTCPQVKLMLVLPHKGHTSGWAEEDARAEAAIEQQADEVTVLAEHYHRGCMHRRNRRLVESAGVCLCYLRSPQGGTAYTVGYAKRRGLRILHI
ncbi:MAG: DUF1273 family protein [Christensenellaceae bacterium]|nr:DUF1273 family protein [Christensenellaceae bacterium]